MAAKSQSPQRTYGHWTRPTSAGLLGLGTLGTGVLFIVLIIATMIMTLSLIYGLIFLATSALMLSPLTFRNPKTHQTGWEIIGQKIGWKIHKFQGNDTYLSGPITRIGKSSLPGLGAAISVHEARATDGEEFAILYHPVPKHLTVVFKCQPEDTNLSDQLDIDAKVGLFGAFLSSLSDHHHPSVVGAPVSITSTPDTGHALREAIANQISENAPDLAIRVMQSVANIHAGAAPALSCEVTITWKKSPGSDIKETATEIAQLIPGIKDDLTKTGAGSVRCMKIYELSGLIRRSFDPLVAEIIELTPELKQKLTWRDAGPAAAKENPKEYFHDASISRTWFMTDPPESDVISSCLKELLGPQNQIQRKRVTLIYRPVDRANADSRVNKTLKDSKFNATSKNRIEARDQIKILSANQTEYEVARGAGLVRFAMIITATAQTLSELERASLAVERAARSSRIRLRVAIYQQAAAFLAALPLGIILPSHSKVPDTLREAAR